MNKKFLSLALAGIVAGSLTACEDSATAPAPVDNSNTNAEQNTEQTTEQTAEQAAAAKLADFTEDCEGRGGEVKVNASCAGGNTCAGYNPDTGDEWTCNGKATCAGSVWCDEDMG